MFEQKEASALNLAFGICFPKRLKRIQETIKLKEFNLEKTKVAMESEIYLVGC